MCHAKEHTPGGLEEDFVDGPLVSLLVGVHREAVLGNSSGNMLTVMDHLLWAANASHVTSPTVARDNSTMLAVV